MKSNKTRNEIRRDRLFATCCLILFVAASFAIFTVVHAIAAVKDAELNESVVVYHEDGKEFTTDHPVPIAAEVEEPEIDIYPVDLDADLQRYIIKKCDEYMLNPSVVIAVCYYESSFNADAVGDNGGSMGLMGISPKWCWPEMERLNCPDMSDPYQNVTVGIDILAQKMAKYDGNPEMALMSYNAGDAGARRLWFDKGVYSTTYSSNVMNMSYALDHGEEF